jgi:hypothetical protein
VIFPLFLVPLTIWVYLATTPQETPDDVPDIGAGGPAWEFGVP